MIGDARICSERIDSFNVSGANDSSLQRFNVTFPFRASNRAISFFAAVAMRCFAKYTLATLPPSEPVAGFDVEVLCAQDPRLSNPRFRSRMV